MRKYTLASGTARSSVDLRDYEEIIMKAVHDILPSAVVCVWEDHYTVAPTPRQGDAVKIGRAICKSALSMYCVQVPKLFTSVEIEEEKEEEKDE